ncbi:MAG: redox-regulated ATPase YchF [Chloroflexota bacterium]
MKLGIIGLPQSGKTTIFNALTRGDRPVSISGGRFEVNTAVVNVPDPRIDALSALFNPKKTSYAKVTYADIAGLEGSSSGDISGPLLNQLSQMDALIHVVRCFDDPSIPHPAGRVDPLRDIAAMDSEFLLSDLIAVENKLERLAQERRRGAGRDKIEVERETALFERLHESLSDEKPLRNLEFNIDEKRILSGFGFLSMKYILLVLNVAEGHEPPEIDYPCGKAVCSVPLQGQLEMDIAQLSPEDAQIFMDEYGIQEPSLNRMIRISYDLLDLISFFTVGEDEVRAWTVRRGAAAPEAAGVIHSDLEKGFIRAEVVTYDDLMELGSMAAARSKGVLRLEGKKYIVVDGDIMHVRFNV